MVHSYFLKAHEYMLMQSKKVRKHGEVTELTFNPVNTDRTSNDNLTEFLELCRLSDIQYA